MDRLSRELRAAMGSRTQEEVGALLGVHQTTISRLLACDIHPGPRLAAALLREWPHLGGALLECFAGRGTDGVPPEGDRSRRPGHSTTVGVRSRAEEGDAAG